MTKCIKMYFSRLILNNPSRIYHCFQRFYMVCKVGSQNFMLTRGSRLHHINILRQNRFSIRKFSNEDNSRSVNCDEISSNFVEYITKWRTIVNRTYLTAFVAPEDRIDLLKMFNYFKPVLPESKLTVYEEMLNPDFKYLDYDLSKNQQLSSLVLILLYLCECINGPLPSIHKAVVDEMYDIQVYSDAGRSHIGGYWGDNWFSVPIRSSKENYPAKDNHVFDICTSRTIVRELNALVECARIWGNQWNKKRVLFHSDNIVVVWSVLHLLSTDRIPKTFEALMVELEEIARHCGFTYSIKWISGKNMDAVDALSRGQVTRFKALYPQANEKPSAYEDKIEIISRKKHPFKLWEFHTLGKLLSFSNAMPCEDGVQVSMIFKKQCILGRGRDEHEAKYEAVKKALALAFNVEHECEIIKSVNAFNTLRHLVGTEQARPMSNFRNDLHYTCNKVGDNDWKCKIVLKHNLEYEGTGDSEDSALQNAAKHVLKMQYNVQIVEDDEKKLTAEQMTINYQPLYNGTVIASTIYDKQRYRAIGSSTREAQVSLIALIETMRHELKHLENTGRMSKRDLNFPLKNQSKKNQQTADFKRESIPQTQGTSGPTFSPRNDSRLDSQRPVLTSQCHQRPLSPPKTLSSTEQALYEKAEKLKSDGKSCVMILRLLYGTGVSYGKLIKEGDVYKCSVTVNGTVYEGMSKEKNQARISAAHRALLESLNFQM